MNLYKTNLDINNQQTIDSILKDIDEENKIKLSKKFINKKIYLFFDNYLPLLAIEFSILHWLYLYLKVTPNDTVGYCFAGICEVLAGFLTFFSLSAILSDISWAYGKTLSETLIKDYYVTGLFGYISYRRFLKKNFKKATLTESNTLQEFSQIFRSKLSDEETEIISKIEVELSKTRETIYSLRTIASSTESESVKTRISEDLKTLNKQYEELRNQKLEIQDQYSSAREELVSISKTQIETLKVLEISANIRQIDLNTELLKETNLYLERIKDIRKAIYARKEAMKELPV